MEATLDVYLTVKPVVDGDKDWHSILAVSALADEDMIKKQYKTSALHTLICPSCREPSLATEVPVPTSGPNFLSVGYRATSTELKPILPQQE